MLRSLSTEQARPMGPGVVPTGATDDGSKTVLQYGNEDETPTKQSRDDKLPNSEGDEQSLGKPKDTEQKTGKETRDQLQNPLRHVNGLAQGNELVVTGLKDALLPAHSNQEGTNDDQDIDLGYESTEEIAAQIEREKAHTEAQLQVQQQETNRLEGLKILKLQQDERRQRAQENEKIRQQIADLTQQINRQRDDFSTMSREQLQR
jgi:hypothetical protein